MPPPISRRARAQLYVRLVIGAALVGIGYGYYRQFSGHVEMTPLLVVEYAARGAIIGALIWAFELFFVQGPRGSRLASLSRGTLFAVRIAVYIVLFEVGYFLGVALFAPERVAALF